MLLICLTVLSTTLLSLVPPVDRDALTHHLYVPKLYLKHGGMVELPAIEFSYYPMNLDLLYIIPLFFGNDILPKFIHMMFGLLTAVFIYRYLVRRINFEMALTGAVFFLTIPVIFRLSFTVYVDLGLIFFSFSSLFYLFEWAENRFRWHDLILAGLLCGLALGTKYNGLVVFFLLAAVVPLIYSRMLQLDSTSSSACPVRLSLADRLKSEMRTIGYGSVFIVTALLVFSPWAIRNMIWKGNPLYPLYVSSVVVNNDTPDPVGPKSTPIGRLLKRKLLYDEPMWETLTVPLRIFFSGQDDNPRYFDGKLNPFLIILPLFTLFYRQHKTPLQKIEEACLFIFSTLFVIIAFVSSDMRIRYVAPIIAPLTILSIMGIRDIGFIMLDRFPAFARKYGRWITVCICMAFLVPNMVYMADQFRTVDPVPHILGHMTRDEYIQCHRPEYAAIRHINQNLNHDANILAMFMGRRGYYFDREVRFDDGMLQSILQKAARPDDVLDRLRHSGITHLLTHRGLFGAWMADSLNDRETAILEQTFQKHFELLFNSDGFVLFEIRYGLSGRPNSRPA